MSCAHVTDPELRAFYAEHLDLLCARCFLDGRPLPEHDTNTTETGAHHATHPSTAAKITRPIHDRTDNHKQREDNEMGFKQEDFFKANYLKAADFPEDAEHTIDRIESELVGPEKELKGILYLRGLERGIVLNKTNFSTLAKGYGDNTDLWTGKPVLVTVKPVSYQGQTVDAIRFEVPRRKAVARPVQSRPVAKPAPEPPDTSEAGWPDDSEGERQAENVEW